MDSVTDSRHVVPVRAAASIARTSLWAPALNAGRVRRLARRRAWALPSRSHLRTVALDSGATIQVRPIRPGDKPALTDAFGRLSDDSRYRRFLGATPSLNDRVLAYLTEVDHRHHCALVAFAPDDGPLIAVARYVRDSDRPGTADIAVTVVDEWQGRGVGHRMLSLLIEHAARGGFERLTATVSATNRPMLELLWSHGFLMTSIGAGVVDLELEFMTAAAGCAVA